MKSKKHNILIAGASGVVGQAVTEHFAALEDWGGSMPYLGEHLNYPRE